MTSPSSGNTPSRVTVSIDSDLEELVPGFLENRRKDAATLARAVQTQDVKTVRLLGHRMKGDGGGYGFDAISIMGAALEQAAAREDRDAIRRHIAELADFLARVTVVYRR